MSDWENNEEIKIFREYLRIPTVHPDIDYEPCIAFLIKQADSLELQHRIIFPTNDKTKPILVLTWLGSEPNLPSILLNSHMDVVPVFEDKWSYPPFEAHMTEDGNIFGRGSQDMKCVGTQYLAAIRILKKEGFLPKRTIHLTFVPDEEIGGYTGMFPFVSSDEFKAMNVGFTLDEGLPSETAHFQIFNAERSLWQIKFKFNGTCGHGLRLFEDTAGEKLQYVLNKFIEYRSREKERLRNNKNLTVGDVTSINLTMISGGVQFNIVPPQLEATFDLRIAIEEDLNVLENEIKKWCDEAGGNIDMEWIQKLDAAPKTDVSDRNIFWMSMKDVFDEMNLKYEVHVFPGGTDSIFIRQKNIPALGFSPIINTKVLLHDHDEYLNAKTYLQGISIYEKLLRKISQI